MWHDNVFSELDVHFVKGVSKAKSGGGVIATVSNCVSTRTEHWSDDLFGEIYMSERPNMEDLPWGSSRRLCVGSESSKAVPYHITDEAHLDVSKSILPRTHIFTQISEKHGNLYVECYLNGAHAEMIFPSDTFRNWTHSPWVSVVYS
jgi:hypothetical protein